MALTDPPAAGLSEESITEKASLSPLEIAKGDAYVRGKIKPNGRTVIPLTSARRKVRPGDRGVYVQLESRERLSRIAYIMGCSFTETVERLSKLAYEPVLESTLLGRIPGEQPVLRNVRAKADMTPQTVKRLEKIAKVLRIGHARNTAALALDAILDGRGMPKGFPSLEAAAESCRDHPLTRLHELGEQFDEGIDGRILLRISTPAAHGIISIMNNFDRRVDWSRHPLKRAVEGLADLPVEVILVGDIVSLPRTQRPLTIPLWAIERLSKIGLDNMLVSRPAFRRPSPLVSETLEYIGQGALRLIHTRRGLSSTAALEASKRKGR